MIADLRREFNSRLFSPEKYQRFNAALEAITGTPVVFRHNETPVFLDSALLETMVRSSRELLSQAMSNGAYRKAAESIIPAQYAVPDEASCPLYVQADFGIVRTAQGLEPRLVEIQGFPSLYGYQPVMAETYRSVYGLDPLLRTYLSDLNAESYQALFAQSVLGDHAPENVVLLEVFPEKQKTLCDFRMTERMTGIRTVCLTDVEVDGRQLLYRRDGRRVPIHRIYNRVIVDELDRLGVAAPFDWNAPLEVEWAGHPNWYFRLSKYSIPFFDHPHVPRTVFLDRAPSIPDDLDNWVLKPLFSFAGLGVVIGPSAAEVRTVPDPANWILQERMRWEPVIETPHGPTMVELRIMFIWFEGGDPIAVNTIVRSGRGKMMGVDHNKNMEWVGASAAFHR